MTNSDRDDTARSQPMVGVLDRTHPPDRADGADTGSPNRRRLSAEDRDAIRRWRSARQAETGTPADHARRTVANGTATEVGGLPDLPDIFDEEAPTAAGARRGGIGNRALILGALLFAGMAVLILPAMASIPGFGQGGDPTATAEQLVTPFDTTRSPLGALAGTAQATRPAVATGDKGVVCIDAGHGGWDPGFQRPSTARAPQMDEAAINLGMAWMLKERLEREGFQVVMTRETGAAVNTFNADVNGDGQTLQIGSDGRVTEESRQAAERDELQVRINICNEANADILVSLHINGYGDAQVRGYEVLYTHERPFGRQSFDLATYIDRELNAHFNEIGFQTEARGVKRDTDLQNNKHAFGSERHLIMTGPAVSGPIGQITPSEMPGVVLEPVFISNDEDAAFLATAENQRVIVDAYADGILQYFATHPAGSGDGS